MSQDNADRFARMHSKNIENLRYRKRQAIEHAREKLGMSWDDNRQRLSFYEYFEEYLKEHGELGYRKED
jgi:U3 small nucleolar ribonucleoprotein component